MSNTKLAAACGLALTLLEADATCPACGWLASEHPHYPHREPRTVEPEPAAKLPSPLDVAPSRPFAAAPSVRTVENSRALDGRLEPAAKVGPGAPRIRRAAAALLRALAEALED